MALGCLIRNALRIWLLFFYSSLLQSDPGALAPFQRGLFPRIPAGKLFHFQAYYNEEVVLRAIRQTGSYRDPGPDSFQACFAQRILPTTGQAETLIVQHVLAGGDLPEGLADVLLVLIHKMEHPSSIAHLCPTSLCNVMYKLIRKVITNRLKDVLSDLIDPAQLSFFPGRHMIDNIIIC